MVKLWFSTGTFEFGLKASGGTLSMIYSMLIGCSALYPGTIFIVEWHSLNYCVWIVVKLGADDSAPKTRVPHNTLSKHQFID
jgi:hypothetical protein